MSTKTIIRNRQAGYNYKLSSSVVAGLVLNGQEVSALRHQRLSLKNSFINFKDDALWLQNLELFPSHHQGKKGLNKRPIKLLLTKKQTKKLKSELDNKGSTIVVTKIILAKYIKIEIAPATGKRVYDKREVLKKRSTQREIARRLKKK